MGKPHPEALKSSEVIAELQRLIDVHGDLPVTLADDDRTMSAREVLAYDGLDHDDGPIVEFCIHTWSPDLVDRLAQMER